MKNSLWAGMVCICISFWMLSETPIYGASVNPQTQTEKLLTAVQKKDFKTIFDLTFFYQLELLQIKAKNPKSIWDKLTKEYYEAKEKAFLSPTEELLPDAILRFGGVLFDAPTDPIEYLRALASILTPACAWKVEEVRKEERVSEWDGRRYTALIVYVGLNYKNVEGSPLVNRRFLKKTILSFLFDTGLYVRSSRVEKGDVYWGGDPSTDFSIAKNLARYGLYDDSINILEGLQQKGAIPQDGRSVLALAYFNKAKRECVVRYSGDYYGLNENCRQTIEKAISLDQNMRKEWVTFLVRYMELNLRSKFGQYTRGDVTVNSVVKAAIDFSTGSTELEKMVYQPRVDFANLYINWARGSQGNHFKMQYLKFAREIMPEDSPPKQTAKDFLKVLIEQELQRRGTNIEDLMNTMEVFDSYKFTIDPSETTLLAKAANLVSKGYRDPFMSGGHTNQQRAVYWAGKAKEWSASLSAKTVEPGQPASQEGLKQTSPEGTIEKRQVDKPPEGSVASAPIEGDRRFYTSISDILKDSNYVVGKKAMISKLTIVEIKPNRVYRAQDEAGNQVVLNVAGKVSVSPDFAKIKRVQIGTVYTIGFQIIEISSDRIVKGNMEAIGFPYEVPSSKDKSGKPIFDSFKKLIEGK